MGSAAHSGSTCSAANRGFSARVCRVRSRGNYDFGEKSVHLDLNPVSPALKKTLHPRGRSTESVVELGGRRRGRRRRRKKERMGEIRLLVVLPVHPVTLYNQSFDQTSILHFYFFIEIPTLLLPIFISTAPSILHPPCALHHLHTRSPGWPNTPLIP